MGVGNRLKSRLKPKRHTKGGLARSADRLRCRPTGRSAHEDARMSTFRAGCRAAMRLPAATQTKMRMVIRHGRRRLPGAFHPRSSERGRAQTAVGRRNGGSSLMELLGFWRHRKALASRARLHYKSGPRAVRDAALPAQVAQLVEHVTENHGVGGSIPPLGTRTFNRLRLTSISMTSGCKAPFFWAT